MIEMLNSLYFLHDIRILCLASSIALLFKIYLLSIVCSYYSTNARLKNIALLGIIVFSSFINEIYWLIISLQRLDIITTDIFALVWFISRTTWAFYVILYLAISLLIENLIRESQATQFFNILKLSIAIILGAYFFILALFDLQILAPYEIIANQTTYFYAMIIGLQTIFKATLIIIKDKIPKLLKYQLKIFIWLLITPYLFFELATANPFAFSNSYEITNYGFITLSSLFLTCAMYFCIRKLVGVRFLNIKDHVEINYNFNFVKDFKKTLGELGHTSNISELKHITQQFFQTAFAIPSHTIHLHIREEKNLHTPDEQKQRAIEYFVNNQSSHPILNNFLYESKIFIKDEIEFSGFYDEQAIYQEALHFLITIKADLFLPIYDKKKLVGYIVIEEDARPKRFYSSVERDEMTVFAAYLNSIINLLRNRNLDALLKQEKDLKEELYSKHQEINQYKESIRSFIRTSQDRAIGVLFYKNRKFLFGNQAAHDLIDCDPNVQQGHPVTHALKQLINKIQNYKSAQTMTYHEHNKKLIIAAIPSNDINGIIITVHYPEIADTIKLQSDLLKDPSQWDYLLYLETTESGQLINQLIPGSGEVLLNFKINLLKTALNRKATLLSMPEADLAPTVEILHTISLRKQLHTIKLTEPEQNADVALKLFGLNPLLSGNQKYEPLLEKLNNSGTLYIENIHLLSMETQEYLAEFLQYSAFRVFKSDQKIASNVRVICSSNNNLAALVEQGFFYQALFNELKKASLTMPALTKLSAHEFQNLAEGLAKQTLKTKPLEQVLTLNTKEKTTLNEKRPVSLYELRKKVYKLLVNKSQKNNLEGALEFGPARLSADPELTHALTLGKEALKDRATMEFLWKKFKSQTKIATLLGVNRSSVNRRCKKYHLI